MGRQGALGSEGSLRERGALGETGSPEEWQTVGVPGGDGEPWGVGHCGRSGALVPQAPSRLLPPRFLASLHLGSLQSWVGPIIAIWGGSMCSI